MRNWMWAALGGVAVAIGALALGFGPWLRARVIREAEARGVLVTPGEVSIDFPRVRLGKARVSLVGVEGLVVLPERLEVEVGIFPPQVTSLEMTGGQAKIEGTIAEVGARLRAWQNQRRRGAPSSERKVRARTERVEGLDVEWLGALGEGGALHVSGAAFERAGGGVRFGADRVEIELADLRLDMAGLLLHAEPARSGDRGLVVTRAGAAEARLAVVLGAAPLAPASPGAPREEQPKAAEEPAKRGGPGLGALMTPHPGRAPVLREMLAQLRERVLPILPPAVVVDRLWVTLRSGGEELGVGPSRLAVEKSDAALRVSFVPGDDAEGTPLELSLEVPTRADAEVTAKVSGGPISLRALGVTEGDFGLSGVDQATVAGEVSVRLAPDAERIDAAGRASVERLTLDAERLAEGPVTFERLALVGQVGLSTDGTRFELRDASIALGDARFEGAFSLVRQGEAVSLAARVRAPLMACQALADSTPRGLLGPVERLRWKGTFSLDASVEAKSTELERMKVKWEFDSQCKVTAAPVELDPERFRAPFLREVKGPGGEPQSVEFGPGAFGYAPIDQVSPYLEKALLVSEDGRFFKHDGFDDRAIESSIADNARAGRFVRGASTISMQLAKNLYLSRDKRLSRKLQEAALTLLLEQTYEKRELLELYVNSIEFGPGVYGVSAAAAHYFSSTPEALTPAQCFFLASILPAPTANYFGPDRKLTPARTRVVHHLLEVAHQRKFFTDLELAAALEEELVFGQASTRPPSGPPGVGPLPQPSVHPLPGPTPRLDPGGDAP